MAKYKLNWNARPSSEVFAAALSHLSLSHAGEVASLRGILVSGS
jgi:hypothetical protein